MLLGVDVGTTCVKAVVFSEDGVMLSESSREYGVSYPAIGYAEQDGEQVFELLCDVIRLAVDSRGDDIKAMSLSVQGDAVTAIDRNLQTLMPFQLGMDYRCQDEAQAFEDEFGAREIFNLTGMRPHPINTLCKIRWIAKHCPEKAKAAYKFVTYSDYLLLKLGAQHPVIDYTMASRTMGMNLSDMTWNPALISAAGISVDQLSTPVPSGTVVGEISRDIAGRLGLKPGVALVAGGHDQPMAALGAGLIAPGLALDSHGTAEVISSVLSHPRTDDSMFNGFFPCYAHVVSGKFFTFSLNHTAGILLKWFVEGFCLADVSPAQRSGQRLYEYVLSSAGNAPSSVIALPYFSGSGTPKCDLSAKGMLAGLTLSTTRGDIARAIVESLAFDMRENLDALKCAGIVIDELRCVGGGARSPIGLKIKADITAMPIHTLKNREAACFGAALLAGVATNVYPNFEKATQLVLTDTTYYPESAVVSVYDQRYSIYRELYTHNRALLARM